MRSVRGKDIAMIFQEPMTSLNPVYTIGDQIAEAIRLHQGVNNTQAYRIAEDALRDVGIADPARRLQAYPHEMSGGMRQRVMIAMALSCQPKLLIADEPTTALDVTIQAQILELLRKLQRERGMAIMLITHDLGVVAENADVVAVMYASRVVEYATVEELFDHPEAPVHRRTVPLDSQARRQRPAARHHQRNRAEPRALPRRVQVSSPLPANARTGETVRGGRGDHRQRGAISDSETLPIRRARVPGDRIEALGGVSSNRELRFIRQNRDKTRTQA